MSTSVSIVAENKNFCAEYIKIWGIVKYYTPYESNIIPKLDSVFLGGIKAILCFNERTTFNKSVKELMKYSNRSLKSKPIYETNPEKTKYTDSLNGWIKTDKNLTNLNRKKLIQISRVVRDTISIFIKNNNDNFCAEFTNEKRYITLYPPVEVRLLALARYWNAINFFFPYKSQISVNWDSTLNDFSNELISCDSELNFHMTILKLCTLIRDGHGSVSSYPIEKYYGYYQLPFMVNYVNDQIIITKIHKSAMNSGIKFGDAILKINNKSFQEFYLKDSILIWGSNSKRKKNISANNFIKSRNEQINEVQIKRNDSIININFKSISTLSVIKSELFEYVSKPNFSVGDNYIYIDLNQIDSMDFEKLIRLHNKPYIIIDIRAYPNWVLNQIDELFSSHKTPFASYYRADLSCPGRFNSPTTVYLNPVESDNKVHYKKMILMVNYSTISRGEFLTMAFQALPNVLTFGDNTAGADGNIAQILLPGNISTNFSGLGIVYPDGQKTQQYGVKIDSFYKNTGLGIARGYDEELNFIIKSIINEKGKD